MQPMNPTPKATPKGGKGLIAIIVAVVLVLAVVLVGALAIPKLLDKKSVTGDLDEDAYYAVFLTNGQVYFGHLADAGFTSSELTDIYYLQVKQGDAQQAVQPAAEAEEGAEGEAAPAVQAQDEAQPELTLVKLGKELHGPEDQMMINNDHVLFYEKLTADSNVVKAINEDKDKE